MWLTTTVFTIVFGQILHFIILYVLGIYLDLKKNQINKKGFVAIIQKRNAGLERARQV